VVEIKQAVTAKPLAPVQQQQVREQTPEEDSSEIDISDISDISSIHEAESLKPVIKQEIHSSNEFPSPTKSDDPKKSVTFNQKARYLFYTYLPLLTTSVSFVKSRDESQSNMSELSDILEDILSSSGPSKESSTNNTRMIILTS
jgi:hypothetical protein